LKISELIKKLEEQVIDAMRLCCYKIDGTQHEAATVFEKLDPQAIKVVLAAQDESRRQAHKSVDCEQLLLGFMADSQWLSSRVFESFGLKHQEVRKLVNAKFGYGNEFVGVETPFTDRLNGVLEASWRAAEQAGKKSIGTKELLIGFVLRADGYAQEILSSAGVNLEKLCSEIARQESSEISSPDISIT